MAASKKKPTRKRTDTTLDPTPRHLWLASLGLLVAARRETGAVAKRASATLENAVADVRYGIRRAEADLRAGVDGVRSQVEPKVQKFSGEVEARLAPIVAKLGLKPKSKRAPRKARKTVAKAPRRNVRKTTKRVAKKAAR